MTAFGGFVLLSPNAIYRLPIQDRKVKGTGPASSSLANLTGAQQGTGTKGDGEPGEQTPTLDSFY